MPRTILRQLKDREQLTQWRAAQSADTPVHLVPTMGALHQGHASLFQQARQGGATVVASLFVNPLQFERAEDLARYPRTVADDCAQLESLGVDAVYLPSVADMYGDDQQITVDPGASGSQFEGAARPGHFAGMLTVVLKLLQRVRPQRAYFGEKDAQQLFLVGQMVKDLDFPVEIVGCPIVREPDGLALSSRNVHLSPAGRIAALSLHAALEAAERAFRNGLRDIVQLEGILATTMEEGGVDVAYAALVEEASFRAAAPVASGRPAWRALVAGKVDGVHLLDNRLLCLA